MGKRAIQAYDTNIYHGYKTNLGVYSPVPLGFEDSATKVTCVKADSTMEGVDIASILDIPIHATALIVFANCTDYDSGGDNSSYTYPLGIFKTKPDVVDFLDKFDIVEQKWEEISFSGLSILARQKPYLSRCGDTAWYLASLTITE